MPDTAMQPVLIAEDDMFVRKGIARVVTRRMYIPVETATYAEAVAKLERLGSCPAAMIVDVQLGDHSGDGLDLVAHVQERFGRHVPALVLTGHSGVATITERALRLRAEFLFKPQTLCAVQLFLERAAIKNAWSVPDVIDMDRTVATFSAAHHLTNRQSSVLFALIRAAERGERADINPNTRKAALRRILAKTGHARFEHLRAAIKLCAAGRDLAPLK